MVSNKRSLQFTPAQQAILTTVLYSDIFSFPLTKDELWRFLISEKKISRTEFTEALSSLKSYFVFHKGYYFLIGKEKNSIKRLQNTSEVEKKMNRAWWVSEKISRIPSILFIGISGGLAAGNATKEDDIDLVVIVKKNTLFTSRLLILGILQLLGVRRFRKQKNTADTICVNLLFDETALSWFVKSQDVYTAREIAQLVPLFERNGMYKKFMSANKWIEHFLPNIVFSNKTFTSNNHFGMRSNIFLFNSLLESFSCFLQMSWMSHHQTNETVTKHILAFHPNDYRFKTLKQLRLKTQQFGLLTKF